MRRLHNSRASHAEPRNLEGFTDFTLEGDWDTEGPDAIAALRPFGRDIPEQQIPEAASASADPPSQLDRALALAARGRRLDAIIVLRDLVLQAPRATDIRLALAQLLAESGEPEEALAELGTALGHAGDRAPTLVRRGALYASLGQPKEAEQDFREAIRSDANYWTAYRYLGNTQLRLGRAEEATATLRDALNLAPQDPEAVLYLGEALLTVGRMEEAFGELKRAVDLAPSDPRGYTQLGRLFDRLGRTEEAMAMHRKAREVTTA